MTANTEPHKCLPAALEDAGVMRLATAEDRRAVAGLAAGLSLPALDWMTMADILEIGRSLDDAPLVCALALLFAALEEGSLCLDLRRPRLPAKGDPALRTAVSGLIERFAAGWQRGDYQRIVGEPGVDGTPLIRDARSGHPRLYFQKYHLHERRLGRRLARYNALPPAGALADGAVQALIEDLFSPARVVRTGRPAQPVVRDPGQVRALRAALNFPFTVISGGPGTGKTSLMVNILRGLAHTGIAPEEIVLAAPTGRAARRMTESLQRHLASVRRPYPQDAHLARLEGRTLHRVLRYRPATRGFQYNRRNPLPAALVLVDEVSMIDVELMDRFLGALDPDRTRLILLGDRDQLPAVEAGAVFAELVPPADGEDRFGERLIVLNRVFRSGARLRNLAAQINRGRWPPSEVLEMEEALNGEADRWYRLDPDGAGSLSAQLGHWTRRCYLEPNAGNDRSYAGHVRRLTAASYPPAIDEPGFRSAIEALFAALNRARVLTLLRNGPLGCTGINAEIARVLTAEGRLPVHPDERTFAGQAIMVTRNDETCRLYNGDTGIVLRAPAGGLQAIFQRSGRYVGYALDVLPGWEPAFAVTVHKSQGSEYDDVLLVLPSEETQRLLSREILYTGVTRARRRVFLRASPAVLAAALRRRVRRESGLGRYFSPVDTAAGRA